MPSLIESYQDSQYYNGLEIKKLREEIGRLMDENGALKIWMAQVLERGHLTVEIIEDARRLLRDNQQTAACDNNPNKHHYKMPSGLCSCQDQSWAR
jgi:hypothetical protein